MLEFLRKKLVGASLLDLIAGQLEALALWIVGGLPGVAGMAVRYVLYKAFFKRLAGFCWITPGVTIVNWKNVSVGRHFGCNTGTYIGANGGITIGDYVLIGSNVTISSGEHTIDGRFPPVFERPVVPKPVRIEDDVWIAAGAVILPGVTLRKGTVIGANAVVTHDTEEYGVYVGAPARMVRSRLPATAL